MASACSPAAAACCAQSAWGRTWRRTPAVTAAFWARSRTRSVDPETLARRGDLAHAYYTVGRLSDATAMLRDTVERCERALPPGDPLTQTLRESLTNIAGA